MRIFLVIILLLTVTNSAAGQMENSNRLDELKITVSAGENREFAFTDKESGYFYGRTHAQASEYFAGWNVSTERIFQDYYLEIDGRSLNRKEALVDVYPHLLRRIYANATETVRMFDYKKVLSVALENVSGKTMAIALTGARIKFHRADDKNAFYTIPEKPSLVVALAAIKGGHVKETVKDGVNYFAADASQGGYLIVLAASESACLALIKEAQREHLEWGRARAQRMETLLQHNYLSSSNNELDRALGWNILSLDALITRQTGDGIYAGLPWFNDYWGRDMFISLPGACLVTGQLPVARKILLSFASYQNRDIDSPYYGRVPNRVRPDEVIYNTTDGTPRFIIALYQYIQYSGDTSLISELYPVIQRSIEGPLKSWVDEHGYLTHDDADTWMDAKRDGKEPFSPRGNRANDIQALWHQQLSAAIYCAKFMKNAEDARRWQQLQERLTASFTRDFLDRENSIIADRLTKAGQRDFSLRPNQLFALDLITDRQLRLQITRKVWQELVYPWGVASLSQHHNNFHPWHEHWDYYHKDEAYHNGTVWLWNNGIAMQRMLEAGQVEPAYNLLLNMSKQTLNMGAVGSLSELTDALPRQGNIWPKLSGTFSQAWSSAEYLRVWYQYFLGIRPDLINNSLVIEPRWPREINHLNFTVPHVKGSYGRRAQSEIFAYELQGPATNITFKLPGFAAVNYLMVEGERLEAEAQGEELRVAIKDKSGKVRKQDNYRKNGDEVERLRVEAAIFQGVTFAQPILTTEAQRYLR